MKGNVVLVGSSFEMPTAAVPWPVCIDTSGAAGQRAAKLGAVID